MAESKYDALQRDNYERVWLQPNLIKNAVLRALEQIQQTGRSWPCTVSSVSQPLVTVNFEGSSPWTLPQVTIPIVMSQWVRLPVQVGDVGIALAADSFLGGISGQGSGVADFTKNYGNLSNLVFLPIAQTSFASMPDANKVWLYGPDGAILSDKTRGNYVEVDGENGNVKLVATNSVLLQGATAETAEALMRAEDDQTALNTFATNIMEWAAANFQSGTSSPTTLAAPTVSGSTKSFSG